MECLLTDTSVDVLRFTVGVRLFLLLDLDFLGRFLFLRPFGHATHESILRFPQIGLCVNSVVVLPSEGGACFAVDALERTLLSFPRISVQALHEIGSCQSESVESPDTLVTLEFINPSIPTSPSWSGWRRYAFRTSRYSIATSRCVPPM